MCSIYAAQEVVLWCDAAGIFRRSAVTLYVLLCLCGTTGCHGGVLVAFDRGVVVGLLAMQCSSVSRVVIWTFPSALTRL